MFCINLLSAKITELKHELRHTRFAAHHNSLPTLLRSQDRIKTRTWLHFLLASLFLRLLVSTRLNKQCYTSVHSVKRYCPSFFDELSRHDTTPWKLRWIQSRADSQVPIYDLRHQGSKLFGPRSSHAYPANTRQWVFGKFVPALQPNIATEVRLQRPVSFSKAMLVSQKTTNTGTTHRCVLWMTLHHYKRCSSAST